MENEIKIAELNCFDYAKETSLEYDDTINMSDNETYYIIFSREGIEKLIKYCLNYAPNQQEATD